METSLFSFDLPDELIAQHPPKERGAGRLMVLDRLGDEGPSHRRVTDLPSLIEPGTLMVFNDTRVRKARLYGENRETGGRGEFLFLEGRASGEWDCIVDKAKKRRVGQHWLFPGEVTGEIIEAPASDRRILRLWDADGAAPEESWFERHGHIPLPPYMKREDEASDAERYQTVFARNTGSAAAPTAGLHFTRELLAALNEAGVEKAWVTLNVGLGTFAPVRSELITDHPMHTERYHVPETTRRAVMKARSEGRPVMAVGTTALRTLEGSWDGEGPACGDGATDIFIYPGYEFRCVDALFTNFHTPHSTLLMLVSAFCGRERILSAYRQAVEERYRFFSYGDAMLIRPGRGSD